MKDCHERGRVCTGFVTCQTEDLQRGRGGQDYLKSTLETLAQLHGTGLHYKRDLGGRQGVLERFPKIEEQIQIQVVESWTDVARGCTENTLMQIQNFSFEICIPYM